MCQCVDPPSSFMCICVFFFGGGELEYSLAAVEPFNCQGRGDESDGEGME